MLLLLLLLLVVVVLLLLLLFVVVVLLLLVVVIALLFLLLFLLLPLLLLLLLLLLVVVLLLLLLLLVVVLLLLFVVVIALLLLLLLLLLVVVVPHIPCSAAALTRPCHAVGAQVGVVKEKPRSAAAGSSSAVRYMEIVALFRTDYWIAGIAPFDDHIAILAFIPEEAPDPQAGRRSGSPAQSERPELRIVSRHNQYISSDALSVYGYQHYRTNDYRYGRNGRIVERQCWKCDPSVSP